MRALVTGGTGFIGSHVVDRLLEKGYDVRAIVRASSNLQWLTRPEIELFFGGLLEPEKLKQAMKDVDVVIHVAGSLIEKDVRGFYDANVKPVKLLLDAAVKAGGNLKKFVLVSSTGAMGPSPDGRPLNEGDPEHPISAYGRSKLEGEQVARAYFKTLPVTIVRPSAVYGPRDVNFLRLFKQVHNGLAPVLGRQDPYFNLVHAQDLTDGIIAAAEHDASNGQTYVLASERPYSRQEIMDTIGDAYGRRARLLVLPKWPTLALAKAYANFQVNVLNRPTLLDADRLATVGQLYWTFDISKAMNELGFKERFSLMDGLCQTYQWYVQQEWLEGNHSR